MNSVHQGSSVNREADGEGEASRLSRSDKWGASAMTRSAHVVIGANFGDKGKGLVTDHLAASLGAGTLVVRFNGGAQAGHTVQTPDGRRHVFHHIGAGAFAGAATYLSRYLHANPLLLADELAALRSLGVEPAYTVDPDAWLTTPFDMMVNQMAEEARGRARHGSCGLGINETVTRSEHQRFATRVRDLADVDRLSARLATIRDDYVPGRLAALGIVPTSAWSARLAIPTLVDWFLPAWASFAKASTSASTKPNPVTRSSSTDCWATTAQRFSMLVETCS